MTNPDTCLSVEIFRHSFFKWIEMKCNERNGLQIPHSRTLDCVGNEQSATFFAGVSFRGAIGGLCGLAIPDLYDTPVEEVPSKNRSLFRAVDNSIEQCFAANIV